MRGKLRLKLSRVISRFQTCRENTSAASAMPPVFYLSPSSPKKFEIEFPTPPPPPRPSPTRRLATVVVSTAGCRSCAPATSGPARLVNLSPEVDLGEDDLSMARGTPAYLWRKEEKWHVVTCAEEVERRRRKIDCEEDDDEDDDDDLFTSIAARRRKREIRRRCRGRNSKSKSRNSRSSVASGSWFSSDDDEENDEREDDYDDGDDTDTLLSSRSFSTDTSIIKPRRQRCCTSPEQPRPSSGGAAATVLSRLVPCGAEQGKVKESFAVVKKSEDPRRDFRRSMAEMVVEKGMYDAADLEQLLHCFLSLNSRHHHRAIVTAFVDIWEALFPDRSPHHVSSSGSCKEQGE